MPLTYLAEYDFNYFNEFSYKKEYLRLVNINKIEGLKYKTDFAIAIIKDFKIKK